MEYEVINSGPFPGTTGDGWAVLAAALPPLTKGEDPNAPIYQALFYGDDAEERAREYALFKNQQNLGGEPCAALANGR